MEGAVRKDEDLFLDIFLELVEVLVHQVLFLRYRFLHATTSQPPSLNLASAPPAAPAAPAPQGPVPRRHLPAEEEVQPAAADVRAGPR